MKHLEDASKDLMDNLIFALNQSMELKSDGVDPMVPFAIVIKGYDKVIKTFLGEDSDYGDQMFEKTIKEEQPDIVVYASDSYITADGIKYDAVLLKAYDRNDSEIYLAGQKFLPKTEIQDFEKIGNPGFLGTVENIYNLTAISTNNQEQKKKVWWKFW